MPFLEKQQYQGHPLSDRLGGWLKQGMPFRGRQVVAYHKNWAYFSELFDLRIRNYIEMRPGIPPTPRHVEEVVNQMRNENIHVIISASYYDENEVRSVAEKVGARAVIVPTAVGGDPAVTNYFTMMDTIVSRIAAAFE